MPRLYLNAAALVKNYGTLQSKTKGMLIPVLKADAYGHGAPFTLSHLLEAGAEIFAVACAYEALELLNFIDKSKPSFTKARIFVMGEVEEHALPPLLSSRVILSVHSPTYAKRLSKAIAHCKSRLLLPERFLLPVHLKLETGMHRLGLRTQESIRAVCALPHIEVTGAYSHLALAKDEARTSAQLACFHALLPAVSGDPFTHLSASEGLLRHGDLSFGGARTGLALYGVSETDTPSLFPVMRFSARVLSVFRAPRGAFIGYGSTRTEKACRLAVLDAGYADGIPPNAGDGGHLFLKGRPSPLVGAVCMDRCTVEIDSLPLREGEEISLFGESPGDTVRAAAALGVSPYALLTVRSARTERIYFK